METNWEGAMEGRKEGEGGNGRRKVGERFSASSWSISCNLYFRISFVASGSS